MALSHAILQRLCSRKLGYKASSVVTFARSACAPSRLIPTSLGLSTRPNRCDLPWARRWRGGQERAFAGYFRRINRQIPDLLAEESAPLIFAAEDSLCPIYRWANISHELLAGWTSGNPNNLKLRELRERTLPLASVRAVKHAAHRQGERELAQ